MREGPWSRRRSPTHSATGERLPHIRSYAAEHRHLFVSLPPVHAGFPLGSWLLQQRRKARSGRLSARTLQELTTLAPSWNPPWPFAWQRTRQQYRAVPSAGRPCSIGPADGRFG
ncbi:helicase associated domain-containing protein [Streptomyces rochei]|uniref:helicase associated domain-containing protein n=1 Tax=Streptomyces rochei TaxID=1928 RepID=UPI0033D3FCC8